MVFNAGSPHRRKTSRGARRPARFRDGRSGVSSACQPRAQRTWPHPGAVTTATGHSGASHSQPPYAFSKPHVLAIFCCSEGTSSPTPGLGEGRHIPPAPFGVCHAPPNGVGWMRLLPKQAHPGPRSPLGIFIIFLCISCAVNLSIAPPILPGSTPTAVTPLPARNDTCGTVNCASSILLAPETILSARSVPAN